MTGSGFTLFLAVHRDLQAAFVTNGHVSPALVTPGRNYVGLREDWYQAVLRAYHWSKGVEVTSKTHILLKVHFSDAAFLHYATTSAGYENNFSPVLFKKVYDKYTGDWKVWHFVGNLPMHLETSPGVLLVSSEWKEIPATNS